MTPGDGRGEVRLWQAVLFLALADAGGIVRGGDNSGVRGVAQRQADAWLKSGPGMPMVAALAGLDGHMIRERWRAGLIDADMLSRRRLVAA